MDLRKDPRFNFCHDIVKKKSNVDPEYEWSCAMANAQQPSFKVSLVKLNQIKEKIYEPRPASGPNHPIVTVGN